MLVGSLLFLSYSVQAAEETEADYDAGFEEPEKLPEPQAQAQVQQPKESKHVAEEIPLIPFGVDAPMHSAKFSIIDPKYYLPFIGGVMLNILVVAVVLVMKRHRARKISYSRMKLNSAYPSLTTDFEEKI